MKGIELSRRYFFEQGLPILRREFPEVAKRCAAGLVAGGMASGAGSELGGFDDELSRDHNWGPRFFLFLTPEDHAALGEAVAAAMVAQLPPEFEGFRPTATTLPPEQAYVVTPDENFRAVTRLPGLPTNDTEWMLLPEIVLFEYTAGEIYYEPKPLISPLRRAMAYYPDNVWLKRLAFACFNLHAAGNACRMARRGDVVAVRFYVTTLLRVVMRLCFLLRRRYAPYQKWLFHAFASLDGILPELVRQVEALAREIDVARLHSDVDLLLDHVGELINASGLIDPQPLRQPTPFTTNDFNLAGFAQAFQNRVRGELAESAWWHGPLDLAMGTDTHLSPEAMRAGWQRQ